MANEAEAIALRIKREAITSAIKACLVNEELILAIYARFPFYMMGSGLVSRRAISCF